MILKIPGSTRDFAILLLTFQNINDNIYCCLWSWIDNVNLGRYDNKSGGKTKRHLRRLRMMKEAPDFEPVSGSVVRQNSKPGFREWILRIEQPGHRLDHYEVEADSIVRGVELSVGMQVRFFIDKNVISNQVHIYAYDVIVSASGDHNHPTPVPPVPGEVNIRIGCQPIPAGGTICDVLVPPVAGEFIVSVRGRRRRAGS